MAQIKDPNKRKEPQSGAQPPVGQTPPAASAAPATPAGQAPPAASATPATPAGPPTGLQILQNAWTPNVDPQNAQQFTGLTQIRQARTNQLTRVVANLTQTYGATDPRTVAAQSSLTSEQTYSSRLGLVKANTATPVPTPPANGWVIYGRVLNADQTPAAQFTVFLADATRAWLQQYAYAFTDQIGYYTLTYASPSGAAIPGKEARRVTSVASAQSLSAYLEVQNSACKLMFVDTTPMSISPGAAIRRDVQLLEQGSVGTPPCDSGAPSQTPPASSKK